LETVVSAILLTFAALLISVAGVATFVRMFSYSTARSFHENYVGIAGKEPECISCPFRLKCPLRVDNGACAFKIFKGEDRRC